MKKLFVLIVVAILLSGCMRTKGVVPALYWVIEKEITMDMPDDIALYRITRRYEGASGTVWWRDMWVTDSLYKYEVGDQLTFIKK